MAIKGKHRKPKRITLRNKADKLFSELIRARGRCEAKGWHIKYARVQECSNKLECAHIYSRRYSALRHDPLNAFCLCSSHHRYFTARPLEFGNFVVEKRTLKEEEYLIKTSQRTGKVDYAVILEGLKNEKTA